jgi:hypothetical protein
MPFPSVSIHAKAQRRNRMNSRLNADSINRDRNPAMQDTRSKPFPRRAGRDDRRKERNIPVRLRIGGGQAANNKRVE